MKLTTTHLLMIAGAVAAAAFIYYNNKKKSTPTPTGSGNVPVGNPVVSDPANNNITSGMGNVPLNNESVRNIEVIPVSSDPVTRTPTFSVQNVATGGQNIGVTGLQSLATGRVALIPVQPAFISATRRAL